MVAHFSDSWRDPAGERLPGAPVGYVLPAGEPLARYEIAFADGATRVVDVRRRFEIADGIIGWGYLPFAAIGHRDEEAIDWRGPHARLTPGRYAPAGHGGALTIMPGSWGAAQTGIVDYVPSFDDDATYWLHAIPLGSDAEPVSVRLVPLGDGRPGTDVVVAGLTLFRGTADPLVLTPRRQVLVEGAGAGLPDVDLGIAIQSRPVPDPAAARDTGRLTGWGNTTGEEPHDAADAASRTVVDLAVTPDARIAIDGWEVAVAELGAEAVSPDGRITIRPLPAADVRVDVRLSVDDEPTAARVRFVAADGRYLPPLGHREEINPGLFEDTGAGLLLGGDTYAYVPGSFQIDLPARIRRGRGREGLRSPAGAPDRPGRARHPRAGDPASSGRSTCAPRAGGRPTPMSTSSPRRPRSSRPPPRT